MAYFRCMGNGSGGVSLERLFVASENSSSARDTDHTHIAYFDDTYGTIDEDTNFSEYLTYNHTTKKFEVLKDFYAVIVPWTYNYAQAQSSNSKGELYINDNRVENWTTGTTTKGYFKGTPKHISLVAGDTFYLYTPVSDGYPEQNLKVYKSDVAYTNLITEELTIHGEMKKIEVGGQYFNS